MPDEPAKASPLWKRRDRGCLAWPVLMAGLWLMLLPLSPTAFALDVSSGIPDAQQPVFNTTRIVLAWDAGHAVLTIDLGTPGQADGHALLLPIPGEVETQKIEAGDLSALEHLDDATAPRLTEVLEIPCALPPLAPTSRDTMFSHRAKNDTGAYEAMVIAPVRIEEIEKHLYGSRFNLSQSIRSIIASYIKQKMRFILVRKADKLSETRPPSAFQLLKISYDTKNFILPIRLNSNQGLQDILLFTLTRHGRVEPANYITTKLKTDVKLPLFIRQDFSNFYQAMFDRANRGDTPRSVLLEYFGSGESCLTCLAPSLNVSDLRSLGATREIPKGGDSQNVYVTRLHARFDTTHFPEDLILNETRDRESFVARYLLPTLSTAQIACPAGKDYQESLSNSAWHQAQELQKLTGWPASDIMIKMAETGQSLRYTPHDTERDPLFYQFLYGGR